MPRRSPVEQSVGGCASCSSSSAPVSGGRLVVPRLDAPGNDGAIAGPDGLGWGVLAGGRGHRIGFRPRARASATDSITARAAGGSVALRLPAAGASEGILDGRRRARYDPSAGASDRSGRSSVARPSAQLREVVSLDVAAELRRRPVATDCGSRRGSTHQATLGRRRAGRSRSPAPAAADADQPFDRLRSGSVSRGASTLPGSRAGRGGLVVRRGAGPGGSLAGEREEVDVAEQPARSSGCRGRTARASTAAATAGGDRVQQQTPGLPDGAVRLIRPVTATGRPAKVRARLEGVASPGPPRCVGVARGRAEGPALRCAAPKGAREPRRLTAEERLGVGGVLAEEKPPRGRVGDTRDRRRRGRLLRGWRRLPSRREPRRPRHACRPAPARQPRRECPAARTPQRQPALSQLPTQPGAALVRPAGHGAPTPSAAIAAACSRNSRRSACSRSRSSSSGQWRW